MSLDKLTHYYLRKHPEEASVMLNQASPFDIAAILSDLTPGERGEIIAYLMSDIVSDYLKSQHDEDIKILLTSVPLKVTVRILLLLSMDEREHYLYLLPINLRVQINALINFGMDSVASRIDTDIFAFNQNLSVRATIESAKRLKTKLLHILYVIDEEFKLVGYVDIRDLLLADREKTLNDIMGRDIVYLPATTKLSKAHMHPAWARVNHLPVVNRSQQFLGVLSQRQLPRSTKTQEPWIVLMVDNFFIFMAAFVKSFTFIIEIYSTPKKVKYDSKNN